ncbi:hypothetical protein MNBD_ACTINO02-843, partial [hydrothermal vent metagenome]
MWVKEFAPIFQQFGWWEHHSPPPVERFAQSALGEERDELLTSV